MEIKNSSNLLLVWRNHFVGYIPAREMQETAWLGRTPLEENEVGYNWASACNAVSKGKFLEIFSFLKINQRGLENTSVEDKVGYHI